MSMSDYIDTSAIAVADVVGIIHASRNRDSACFAKVVRITKTTITTQRKRADGELVAQVFTMRGKERGSSDSWYGARLTTMERAKEIIASASREQQIQLKIAERRASLHRLMECAHSVEEFKKALAHLNSREYV